MGSIFKQPEKPVQTIEIQDPVDVNVLVVMRENSLKLAALAPRDSRIKNTA